KHPQGRSMARQTVVLLHHRRRDTPAVQAQAERFLTLATAQSDTRGVGQGTCWQGWIRVMHGEREAGLAQLRQGMAVDLATGQELSRPLWLVLLAEALRALEAIS